MAGLNVIQRSTSPQRLVDHQHVEDQKSFRTRLKIKTITALSIIRREQLCLIVEAT